MLLTNIFNGVILPSKIKKTKKGGFEIMFIYEDLKKMESEENKELAVSPIEYVVLNCGR